MKTKSDKAINMRVPTELYSEFQQKCEKDGISVATALKQFMQKQIPPKPTCIEGWYNITGHDNTGKYPDLDATLDFIWQGDRTAPFNPKMVPRSSINGVPNGYEPFVGSDNMIVGKIEIVNGKATGCIISHDNQKYGLGPYSHWRYHLPWPQGKPITIGEKLAAEYVAASGRSTELAKAIDAKIEALLIAERVFAQEFLEEAKKFITEQPNLYNVGLRLSACGNPKMSFWLALQKYVESQAANRQG